LGCTLARRLRAENASGVVMRPADASTLEYVESTWNRLDSGEWPETTKDSTLQQLHWTLLIDGEAECDMRLVDFSGQQFRRIFSSDGGGQAVAVREDLRDYCHDADIVLFLINLFDYVGQGNSELVVANQNAMKSSIDRLLESNPQRSIAIVLTQAEQYQPLVNSEGGWMALLSRELPYLYEAHIAPGSVPVFPVSAVFDTQLVPGEGRRAPKPGFRSAGLIQLVEWMAREASRRVRSDAVRQHRNQLLLISFGIIVAAIAIVVVVALSKQTTS
jgi:hypothetical protein